MNKFKCLGVNDDKDFCMCCGKVNLKAVVWIENTETGEIKHFGTTCATKPQKGFAVESEVKTAKQVWAGVLQLRWRKARALYRQQGGKWEEITKWDDKFKANLTVGWTAANKELYAECLRLAA